MSSDKNKTIIDTFGDTTAPVENIINQVEQVIDNKLKPERESAFKRYPKLFTLLVAFGVSATYYGFENILDRYLYGTDHLFLIMIGGIFIKMWIL